MKNITVSVEEDFYKQIRIKAAYLDISVSELVRKKLSEVLEDDKLQSSYELGKDLFGKGSIGPKNLSENRKQILKNKINQKHAKRSTR
ncbi:MAG: CopG family transcriptional regulator [Leptospiraceae bacterium]|nr:CopG family transcriptional regulator [Leptospiraceae bacterium]